MRGRSPSIVLFSDVFETSSRVERSGARAGLLVEPLVMLDSVERRKARLLATLLLCVLALGLTSAVVQAAVVPNFQSTLVAVGIALGVLFFAYAGASASRAARSAST